MASMRSILDEETAENSSPAEGTQKHRTSIKTSDPDQTQREEKRKSISGDRHEEKRKSIDVDRNEERRTSIPAEKLEEKRKSIGAEKTEEHEPAPTAQEEEEGDDTLKPKESGLEIEDSEEEDEDEEHIFDFYKRKDLLRDDSQEELGIVSHTGSKLSQVKSAFLSLMPSYLAKEVHGLRTKSLTESRLELMERQKTYVTVFESIALGVVLEELDLQLEILGHTFPGTFAVSDESDFLTYDEKFSMEVAERDLEYLPELRNFKNPFIIDEATIGTHAERMAAKVQKDRAFLHKIISLAKQEIIETRSFEHLKENVKREDGRRHEEITLMEREKQAQEQVRLMTKKLTDYKLQSERDEHNRKELINHLRDQLFDNKQKGYRDARYTRGKYGAKNDFTFWQLKHQTDLQKLKIKNLEIEMTRDRDSNINIESWSEILCSEILKNTAEWTEKFDRDLEDIEKRIRDKNDSIRNQKTLMDELNAEIEQHMIVLGPYEEEKIENFRRNLAARRIQRWWRKYMKKNKLYKKKKGKGKGKGKGKKGKKGRKSR